MSQITSNHSFAGAQAIVGEPEVVEDVANHPSWIALKDAASALRPLEIQDGSIPDETAHAAARSHVETITTELLNFRKLFPHDTEYLEASVRDFERWASDDFGAPDFFDSLMAFHPERNRVDGLQHVVIFPMYTQNGSTDRLTEAVLIEVIW
ncbi:MAG: DUF6421 family protein, partial [Lacisediminihabitans sp.]